MKHGEVTAVMKLDYPTPRRRRLSTPELAAVVIAIVSVAAFPLLVLAALALH